MAFGKHLFPYLKPPLDTLWCLHKVISLRSGYENATPNLCWVFCALLGVVWKGGYAPINVKHLIVSVGPWVRHLTDLVLPGEGIFESFFARRGDIWLPTRTKKTESEHMFPSSTLHPCAIRFEKIRKSWRPMRTSKGWVDFTVLSSNFVCFSVFLINWTS